jgi:hypothetical protein
LSPRSVFGGGAMADLNVACQNFEVLSKSGEQLALCLVRCQVADQLTLSSLDPELFHACLHVLHATQFAILASREMFKSEHSGTVVSRSPRGLWITLR